MKTRRRKASENAPTTISRRRRREYSELPIPTDLFLDILSRLPANSIARCRCVSKLWNSTLGRPEFTDLFFTKSLARPHLLFSVKGNDDGKMYFFSSPQISNRNETSSAIHHMNLPCDMFSEICGSVHGLVCLSRRRGYDFMPVICNTSTGQCLSDLPKVTMQSWFEMKCFFGYDPIRKQFKVLPVPGYECYEHPVLTLGTGKLSWREVDREITHWPLSNGVCIDGILYYIGRAPLFCMVVCFDCRSEEFRFIKLDETEFRLRQSTLVNYKGKLGALFSDFIYGIVTAQSRSFEMWVLEDPEKQVWSRQVYQIPLCNNITENTQFYFAGVYGTNEIVLSPQRVSDPFYVFYYNLESRTIRRVEIRGMGAFKNSQVHTSVDHVEDVKLMEMFRSYNLRPRNRS